MLQHFTTNVKAVSVRKETLQGRSYTVVPMVMAKVGVLNGSNGALFYPEDELAKLPETWNTKPTVVYHPEINGKGASACLPLIMETQSIGMVMNTRFDSSTKKLLAEAWIDELQANKVDKRVMEAVSANKMMEVSTGLFTDNEEVAGEYEGKPYTAIARNYRPDHLAILPDQIGACSIDDGAGLLRLNSSSVVNGLSFDSIRTAVTKAIKTANPPSKDKDALYCGGPYVEELYKDFAIYSLDMGCPPCKLYRINYKMDGQTAVLDGQPEEVVRVTEYRTLDGSYVGNAAGPKATKEEKETVMTKNQMVDKLIADKIDGVTEEERAGLMGLSETVLSNMLKPATNAKPMPPKADDPDDEDEEDDEPAPPPKKGKKGTTNKAVPVPVAPVPLTPEQYIANAPAGVRDVLQDSLFVHNAEKDQLVATIIANEDNLFQDADLRTKPIGELRAIARLANRTVTANIQRPNYLGAAAGMPTSNSTASKQTPLGLPTMNFGSDK